MNFDKLKKWFHAYCISYAAVLILLAVNACRVSETVIERYPCQQETLAIDIKKADSTTVAITKAELDSLKFKIENLVNKHIEFEDKYLSDLRQESNNNINKYNGWLSLWLALLAVLMGIVPFYFTLKVENVRKEVFDEHLKNINEAIGQRFEKLTEDVNKTKTSCEESLNKQIESAKRSLKETKDASGIELKRIKDDCKRDLASTKDKIETQLNDTENRYNQSFNDTITKMNQLEQGFMIKMAELKIQCTADCIHAAYDNQLLIDSSGRDKLWQSMLSTLRSNLDDYQRVLSQERGDMSEQIIGLRMVLIHVHSVLNLWLPLLLHKHQSREAALLLRDIANWIAIDCPSPSITTDAHLQNAKPLLERVNSLIIKRS